LLVQSLSFVKCMPHLIFLDISWCTLLILQNYIIYHVTQDWKNLKWQILNVFGWIKLLQLTYHKLSISHN
jgi:hypothetical protein